MAKEQILLTGCAGFIGGHTLDRLVGEGFSVVGLDDLSTGSADNMAASWGKFRFIEGSVTDPVTVADAVRGVDRIIHLASVPSVPRSVAAPLESAHASIIGTVTLLDAARSAGVKRVVQAASSSAYGDNPMIPRVETTPPAPISPYAVAKLCQEYYARSFFLCYGLDTVSLRYFNVFGPRQSPFSKYAAVIPKFIVEMRQGRRPEVYGDGTQTRDFTYIDNVVEANLQAAFAPGPLAGETLNIGNGDAHSLVDLVVCLNKILGTDLEAVFADERSGDVKHSFANIEKAAISIGYAPRIGFLDGLAKTAASFE